VSSSKVVQIQVPRHPAAIAVSPYVLNFSIQTPDVVVADPLVTEIRVRRLLFGVVDFSGCSVLQHVTDLVIGEESSFPSERACRARTSGWSSQAVNVSILQRVASPVRSESDD